MSSSWPTNLCTAIVNVPAVCIQNRWNVCWLSIPFTLLVLLLQGNPIPAFGTNPHLCTAGGHSLKIILTYLSPSLLLIARSHTVGQMTASTSGSKTSLILRTSMVDHLNQHLDLSLMLFKALSFTYSS